MCRNNYVRGTIHLSKNRRWVLSSTYICVQQGINTPINIQAKKCSSFHAKQVLGMYIANLIITNCQNHNQSCTPEYIFTVYCQKRKGFISGWMQTESIHYTYNKILTWLLLKLSLVRLNRTTFTRNNMN